jgi:hypothetical protein
MAEQGNIERIKAGLQLMEGGMKVCPAAARVGLTHQLLRRRASGEVAIDARNGPNTVLSSLEEQAVVDCCIHMGSAGMGLTKGQLLDKVVQICSYGRAVHGESEGLAKLGQSCS